MNQNIKINKVKRDNGAIEILVDSVYFPEKDPLKTLFKNFNYYYDEQYKTV